MKNDLKMAVFWITGTGTPKSAWSPNLLNLCSVANGSIVCLRRTSPMHRNPLPESYWSVQKGKASGLLLVKPLGDKMPYGTRQEAAQKPEYEGFQHQLFLCLRSVHTNAKDPTGKTYGATKNPASCTSAENGDISIRNA